MAGRKLDAQIRISGVQITCAEDPLSNDLAVGGKVDEVPVHCAINLHLGRILN